MRILYIDIDSLRPDHLGCYGYHRNTSPTIDRIAHNSIQFNECYVSDAPCLPSRTALITGRAGIHTGVVNHGGTCSEPFRVGPSRPFRSPTDRSTLFECLTRCGWHTTSITPFPTRHGAWHFLAGVNEHLHTGGAGLETADQVNSFALPWLQKNAKKDKWFLHLNYWDPHRPYRTPESYGNPFQKDPIASWYTESIRKSHWEGCGLQSAQDPNDGTPDSRWPRMPKTISSMDEYKRWIDGYDTGIRYTDDHIQQLLQVLESEGVLEDTAIIISADHGENQGELNHYGAHRTGDAITHHVPLIIRWPGIPGGSKKNCLIYQFDLSSTILDLLKIEQPPLWHGRSFAESLQSELDQAREYLVLGQLACMAQRSVRFDDWILLRTWHDGFSCFPEFMLFNLKNDPNKLRDLASERPDIVEKGRHLLEAWTGQMMETHPATEKIDPLEIVMKEEPYHATRAIMETYCKRLRNTGRNHLADRIENIHLATRPNP